MHDWHPRCATSTKHWQPPVRHWQPLSKRAGTGMRRPSSGAVGNCPAAQVDVVMRTHGRLPVPNVTLTQASSFLVRQRCYWHRPGGWQWPVARRRPLALPGMPLTDRPPGAPGPAGRGHGPGPGLRHRHRVGLGVGKLRTSATPRPLPGPGPGVRSRGPANCQSPIGPVPVTVDFVDWTVTLPQCGTERRASLSSDPRTNARQRRAPQ